MYQIKNRFKIGYFTRFLIVSATNGKERTSSVSEQKKFSNREIYK